MATEEQAKVRRIVDLDVKEVSLVDRPAIRRTFLVIKREEEEPMGAFAPEKDEIRKSAETEDEQKKKAGKGKDESACKDEDEEEAEKKKAFPPIPPEDEEKKKAKADEEEEMTKGSMNPKALAGMISSIKGAPKDAVDKLVAFLETKQKAAKPEDEYPSPKTKSENLVVVKADGTVEINAGVTKGRKMLTQQRSNMIKDTIISLARVLHEADEETSKAMIEEMKALPSNSSISSAVQPVGPKGKTKAEKEEEDEVEKLKGEVTKLTKRLEGIEGTRQVSKSASEEGTDEKKAIQKSLWSGVL
jgi:hypothetical protein